MAQTRVPEGRRGRGCGRKLELRQALVEGSPISRPPNPKGKPRRFSRTLPAPELGRVRLFSIFALGKMQGNRVKTLGKRKVKAAADRRDREILGLLLETSKEKDPKSRTPRECTSSGS